MGGSIVTEQQPGGEGGGTIDFTESFDGRYGVIEVAHRTQGNLSALLTVHLIRSNSKKLCDTRCMILFSANHEDVEKKLFNINQSQAFYTPLYIHVSE